MGTSRVIYNGKVEEDGTFKVYGYAGMVSDLADHFRGKDVVITVTKKVKSRSKQQNKYYWGVIVKCVQDGFYEMGEVYDSERVHETLKAMFLYDEIINEDTGEIVKVVKEFKDITADEFQEYKIRIQQWAAEWLGIVILDPNEQSAIDYTRHGSAS